MLSHHAPPHWPQFYLTRVIGTRDLPDVEILTRPDYRLPNAISDLKELQRQIMIDESFRPVRGSDTRDGADVCFHALFEAIADVQRENELPINYDLGVAYANQIFSSRPVPVMNSPLSGSTLLQMTASAGSGNAEHGEHELGKL
jgi:hypothetical protein